MLAWKRTLNEDDDVDEFLVRSFAAHAVKSRVYFICTRFSRILLLLNFSFTLQYSLKLGFLLFLIHR